MLSIRMTTAEDIMTRDIVTLFEEDNLTRIETAMRRFHFHQVPVVDGLRVVGMVSHERLLELYAGHLDPTAPLHDATIEQLLFVRDVMTTRFKTARPDAPIEDLLDLMLDERQTAIPIVADSRRLVGIVTHTDVLVLLRRSLVQRAA